MLLYCNYKVWAVADAVGLRSAANLRHAALPRRHPIAFDKNTAVFTITLEYTFIMFGVFFILYL